MKLSETEKNTIILGDVNVDFLKSNISKEFNSILQLYSSGQLIDSPTRIHDDTETLIDIIASNKSVNISRSSAIPCGIADHELIGCVRKVNHIKYPSRKIYCRDYRKYEPAELNDHLSTIDWSVIYSCRNVNSAWNAMKEMLISAFNRLAPKITKQVRGKSSPWLSFDIKAEMNKRDKLMRKARKSKNKNIHEEYKRKRNKVNSMIRKAKSNYTRTLLSENSNNPTGFWAAIKRVFPSKSKTNRVERSFDIAN